jgi:predicted acylesterase/phospholipase RssA
VNVFDATWRGTVRRQYMTRERTGQDELDAVAQKIKQAVAVFLGRGSLETSTLTLDGPGPNGALQASVLFAVGPDRLERLRRINILSASTYPYVGLVAKMAGQHRWDWDDLIHRWDAAHRRAMDSRLGRALKYLLLDVWRRRPLFAEHALSSTLRALVPSWLAELPVAELPGNVCFWLYDVEAKRNVPVCRGSELERATLAEVVDCAASVPRIFAPGRIGGRAYIDPVYAPLYRSLLRQLRDEADNHLIANVVKDRVTDSEVYVKPHGHRDGRKMLSGDFLRLALNLHNPRPGGAYRIAERLEALGPALQPRQEPAGLLGPAPADLARVA